MTRHYCTSIANAIKYFETGSKRDAKAVSGGKVYSFVIPPYGFEYINVTDNNGITFHFNGWFDYADILRRGTINNGNRIVKIKLCYTK